MAADLSSNLPSVSIVIPCYNQGEFVLEAIASVERLQGVKWELIIVNDGSNDRQTQTLLKDLDTTGYHVIHQDNQGLAAARNTGISHSQGRYILPLDADNKLEPLAVLKAIALLDDRPEVGVVFGYPMLFGTQTGLLEVPQFNLGQFLLGNSIDACALYRREIWQQVGGYDSQIPGKLGYEDWDFWLGAIEHQWAFHHLAEVTFYYRCREVSMVSGCNIPENRRQLFRYLCTKHHRLYTSHFAEVFAAKEAERLQALAERDELRAALAPLPGALAAERDRFRVLHDLWSAREAARLSLEADRDRLLAERQHLSAALDHQRAITAAAQAHLTEVSNDRELLLAKLAAIQTSKFWRLRRRWRRLWRWVRGGGDRELVE